MGCSEKWKLSAKWVVGKVGNAIGTILNSSIFPIVVVKIFATSVCLIFIILLSLSFSLSLLFLYIIVFFFCVILHYIFITVMMWAKQEAFASTHLLLLSIEENILTDIFTGKLFFINLTKSTRISVCVLLFLSYYFDRYHI